MQHPTPPTKSAATTLANANIELYLDPAGEGEQFLGNTAADDSGNWAYDLPVGADPGQTTALATDADGNSSAFSATFETVTYTVGNDGAGQTTIFVTRLISRAHCNVANYPERARNGGRALGEYGQWRVATECQSCD